MVELKKRFHHTTPTKYIIPCPRGPPKLSNAFGEINDERKSVKKSVGCLEKICCSHRKIFTTYPKTKMTVYTMKYFICKSDQ